jgi:hypothetical protein
MMRMKNLVELGVQDLKKCGFQPRRSLLVDGLRQGWKPCPFNILDASTMQER